MQDWWTDALVVLSVGMAAPFAAMSGRRDFQLPLVALVLLLMAVLLAACNVLALGNASMSSQTVASLAVMLLLALFLANHIHLPHRDICILLATAILLGACLQALLGMMQTLGLASLSRGLVLYDVGSPTEILGNIGQRNQYAQYLSWGVLAICYLHGRKALKGWFAAPLLTALIVLITWTGARLPLAYFLGILALAWFWLRRSPQDEDLRRMAASLSLAIILLVLVQVFNHEIVGLLNWLGLPIDAQSGSNRMLEGGFGARRRVEWTKAWLVFLEHPWLGVGVGRYAAQSVWLEAFGGLPKYPESVLFTQSHNLIFQLLAETGLIGTLCAGIGLLGCLLPFFARGRQSPENLMLLSIALMILVHSMFEFPLWYLPFLSMLVIVCVLGPALRWRLQIRTGALRGLCAVAGVLMLAHVLSGAVFFWRLIEFTIPSAAAQENMKRVEYVSRVGLDPMWSKPTDLILSNYLLPGKRHLDMLLPFYEGLAKDQPYVAVMLRLSVCRALAGQERAARDAMAQAIANYPDETPKFVLTLQTWSEPEIQPLKEMALQAAQAYQEHGTHTDAARLAAVMTVATPVTRSPLF
ncbi:hypothetical protein UF16_00165 [Chromobacterium violaceum]|nr:hypothetical protein UF16_00165 [Chromobacterium violaceum]